MTRIVVLLLWLVSATSLAAQGNHGGTDQLPPEGYGRLNQNDLSLRLRTNELEVRFIPLDQRVLRLLARDAYESLVGLVRSRRASIDSVGNLTGVSRPGLALVSYFALSDRARIDPQTLTVMVRNRVFQPLGIVPMSPRFSAQQLNVREQVSGIYLFEEDLPVDDSFTISYNGLTSDDWQGKQRDLDRERARVAARARSAVADSTRTDSGAASR
jgi:hypothetical protein